MKIGRMAAPVHALGPGERLVLWTQGCSKACPGCISPELQPREGQELPEELLAEIITDTARRNHCRGLTISGGDPLEQSEALERLLQLLRPVFEDILVYTGYTLAEIREGRAGAAGLRCLKLMDVLIDGPYVAALNRRELTLRGSANQVIHYLNPQRESDYLPYLSQGRRAETFVHGDTVIVTGILNP